MQDLDLGVELSATIKQRTMAGNRIAAEEHWLQLQQDIVNKQAKWGNLINSIIYANQELKIASDSCFKSL